jgi:hypothetical protein
MRELLEDVMETRIGSGADDRLPSFTCIDRISRRSEYLRQSSPALERTEWMAFLQHE